MTHYTIRVALALVAAMLPTLGVAQRCWTDASGNRVCEARTPVRTVVRAVTPQRLQRSSAVITNYSATTSTGSTGGLPAVSSGSYGGAPVYGTPVVTYSTPATTSTTGSAACDCCDECEARVAALEARVAELEARCMAAAKEAAAPVSERAPKVSRPAPPKYSSLYKSPPAYGDLWAELVAAR